MLPRIRQLVLVSGDSDFVPLLSLARRSGVRVVLAALPMVTSSALTGNADVFVSIEALVSYGERQRPTGGPPAPAKRVVADQIVIRPGQEFASYELIRGLFVSAVSSVTVIDNYIDEQVLYMLQVVAPEVCGRIFTSKIQANDFGGHVRRLQGEGRTLDVFRAKNVHDRLLRIDDDWIHSGASFKDLGAKVSVLNRMKRPVPADDLDILERELLATAQRLY